MMAYVKGAMRGGHNGVTVDYAINNQLGRGEINYATILTIMPAQAKGMEVTWVVCFFV